MRWLLRRPHVVGVPRLARCRRRGTRARRAPRSRALRTPRPDRSRPITMPATTLRPSSQKFGDSPEVHRVDPRAGAPARPPDLLGRHRGVDRSDHLGIAVPALHAGRDDVGGDRDQLRLERRALSAERLGDRRVVGDQPVRFGLAIDGRRVRHGRSRGRRSSRPRRRRRSTVRRSRSRTPSRTALGTRGSRSRCGFGACRSCR